MNTTNISRLNSPGGFACNSDFVGLSSKRSGHQAFNLRIRVRTPLTLFSFALFALLMLCICPASAPRDAKALADSAFANCPSGLAPFAKAPFAKAPFAKAPFAKAPFAKVPFANPSFAKAHFEPVVGKLDNCFYCKSAPQLSAENMVLSSSGQRHCVVSAKIGGSNPLSTAMGKIVQW